MSSKILLRRGTAAQWSSANPILGIGELGIETDTLKIKIGNGSSTWSQLSSYANVTPAQLTSEINNLISAAPATLDTLNELAAAINNDASFSTTVNNLLTGKVSKSGGDTITASTSSTVGLILKAAASQTSNLIEIQDSTGGQKFIIGGTNVAGDKNSYYGFGLTSASIYGGFGRNNNTGLVTYYQQDYAGAGLLINSGNAGTIPFAVKGAASQTANLQEWQDSGGTALVRVTSSGVLGTSVAVYSPYYQGHNGVGGTIAFANATAITITPQSASVASLIVKGAASQTANLQEWQNSAGTVLTSILPEGFLNLGTNFAAPLSGRSTGTKIILYSSAGAAMDYGIGVQSGAVWYTAPVGAGHKFYSNNFATEALQIGSSAITANIPITINGTNSSGVTTSPLNLTWNSQNNWGLSIKQIYNTSPSGSIDYSLVTHNDSATDINAIFIKGSGLIGFNKANQTTAQVWVNNSVAGNVGLIIQGAASQYANLQEWQNSAGTVLGAIKASGATVFKGDVWNVDTNGYEKLFFEYTTNTYYKGNNHFFRNNSDTQTFKIDGLGSLTSNVLAATSVALTVKGYASQTANLQEWQDSTGGLLAVINNSGQIAAYGRLTVGSSVVSTDARMVLLNTGTTTSVLQIIRGIASQTADLTQWQNSAGTVVASISPTGKLTSAVDASINGMTIGLGGGNVSSNVAFGQGALASNVSGQNNTAIGYNALNSSTSYFNVAIGGSALQALTTGGTNVALGVLAMRYATTADSAVAIGYSAAGSTTTGGYFVAIGAGALGANVTGGTDTVAIGYAALNQATATSLTTAVGSGAGYALTTGTQNTYLGRVADGVTTGSNNMMLGYSATSSSATVSNEITLGNSSITRFRIPGIGLNITSNSTINTASAATVGLIVKGAASQTANLTEWQASDGTIRAAVDANGFIVAGAGSAISNAVISARPFGASQVGVAVRGAASQSANLQEWQNSSGTVLSRIDNTGNAVFLDKTVYANQLYVGNGNYLNATMHNVSGGAADIRLLLRAHSSQTANIQEWQNSAGTVLAKVAADGNLTVGNTTGTIQIKSTGTSAAYPSSGSGMELLAGTASGTDAIITYNRDTSAWRGLSIYSSPFRVFNAGVEYLTVAANNSVGINNPTVSNVTLGVISNSASNVTLAIKGAASQSADLQQWTNSAATVLARVESGGALNISPVAATNGYSIYALGLASAGILSMKSNATSAHAIQLQNSANTVVFKMDQEGRIVPAATTSVGLTVRGIASQTANLQEWQNSSGTVLGRVDNYGAFYLSETVQIGPGTTDQRIAGGGLSIIHRGGTSSVTFGIKAIASQTGDLTQWQNSAGTVLASIASDGTIRGGGSFLVDGTYGITNIRASTLGGSLNVGTGYSAQQGIIVRGAASQTAALQEWQNSSGTVLAKVAADGQLSVGNGTSNYLSTYDAYGNITSRTAGTNYSANISVLTGATSYIGMVIRGQASQTANLQEWQDSSGTVFANINSIGTFTNRIQIYADNTSSGSYSLVARTNYNTVTPVSIQAAASQTANLTNWTNSSGFDTLRVLSGGSMLLGNVNVNAYNYISFIKAGGGTGGISGLRFGSDVDGSGQQTLTVNTADAHLTVTNLDPAGTFIIKGATSQSANLQEWRNVGGTVLAKITASGALDVTAITVNGAAITSTPTTSDVELMNIMGAY